MPRISSVDTLVAIVRPDLYNTWDIIPDEG